MTNTPFDFNAFREQVRDGYARGDVDSAVLDKDAAKVVEMTKVFADAYGEVAAQTMKVMIEGGREGVDTPALIRALNMLSISAITNAINIGAKHLGRDEQQELRLFAMNDYINGMHSGDVQFVTGGAINMEKFRGN